MIVWTADREQALRECVADGRTASQTEIILTTKFGRPFSRSAVIAKAKRLKLKWRNAPNKLDKPSTSKKVPSRRLEGRQGDRPFIWLVPPQVAAAQPAPVPAAPDSRPCDIMGLTDRRCRWPLWEHHDDPRLYCGAETGGQCYCVFHFIASRNKAAA
jgi:hypothetical protein